jgi:uncharacterized linocin/CFP29 family protein
MDLLKKQLAPISESAWKEIDEEARNALGPLLSGRKLVDVAGPLGPDVGAVNLGRLDVPGGQDERVKFGVRRVLPLVEVRVRFELDIWELDNIDRGSKDPDLDDLRRAAGDIAKFEENAIYNGFPDAAIRGLVESSEHEPVTVADDPASILDAAVKAVTTLRLFGVEGPFSLALGVKLQEGLDSGKEHGYPIRDRILHVIEGSIVFAPYLAGGLLVSGRGGDSELSLGQDISIGYHNHDDEKVRLYFTESLTFRVLASEAVVRLETK